MATKKKKTEDAASTNEATGDASPSSSAAMPAAQTTPPGVPPTGYPTQGYAPPGYPPQGYAPPGYPPQGYPPPGYPPQGYAPPGYPPQSYAPPQGGTPAPGPNMAASTMTSGPPGYGAPPAWGGQPQNPMLAFFQMFQAMSGGGMGGGIDPSAIPFGGGAVVDDHDRGLDADIIRPSTIKDRVKSQGAIPMGSVLDVLCLSDDGERALGGIPQGCTIAFAGPPGKGKTRSVLAGLSKVAATGEKVAFIVAEEGFHDETDSGRDDLCSRLEKIGRAATGLSESDFAEKVLNNVFVLEAQYHKGQSWDDFVTKYRYLVERQEISFVVIDSLNMLDPSKNRTADNLSALKTYNHAHGITCLCVGQIRDSGGPVGGEALMHTADAVFMLEEFTLSSKELAETWGGSYRDRIDVIKAMKSVTTPVFAHPIRVERGAAGELVVSPHQPATMAVKSSS